MRKKIREIYDIITCTYFNMIHLFDLMTLYFNNLNHVKFTFILDLKEYYNISQRVALYTFVHLVHFLVQLVSVIQLYSGAINE